MKEHGTVGAAKGPSWPNRHFFTGIGDQQWESEGRVLLRDVQMKNNPPTTLSDTDGPITHI